MTDMEKVIKGLDCCASMTGSACAKCPYKNQCDDVEFSGAAHLCANALELLKEQEPGPMTLEEVKKAEGTVVWIETPGCENTVERYALVECVNERSGFVELNLPFGEKPAYEKGKCAEYGKAWRCWKERPDEDQRMKVKWDE